MTSLTQDLKNLKKILDIFVLLVTFEILSHYPNIDSSNWLREDVQWNRDKNFMKNLWFKWLRHFSIEFLVFAFFCCCFNCYKTYCDVLMINYS